MDSSQRWVASAEGRKGSRRSDGVAALFRRSGLGPAANLELIVPRLPCIAIDQVRGRFLLPDGQATKALTGVILHFGRFNAWWRQGYEEGMARRGLAPDCWSLNGKSPAKECMEPQSEDCGECIHSLGSRIRRRSGTGRNDRICKRMRRVHVMLNGELVPYRLLIPPLSVRNFDGYVTLLASKRLVYCSVMTCFSLERGVSRSGKKRWFVRMERAGVIKDKHSARRVILMRRAFRQAMGVRGT